MSQDGRHQNLIYAEFNLIINLCDTMSLDKSTND